MTSLTKTAAGSALFTALGAAALGIGATPANAAPAPAAPGIVWAEDNGHGDWEDWNGHDNGYHRGWYKDDVAPGIYVNLPCVSGPYGYVTVCP